MRSLLEKIIAEASIGKIDINGDIFPIAFSTIVYKEKTIVINNKKNDQFPILLIKDMDCFLEKLIQYVGLSLKVERKMPTFFENVEHNQIKLIICYIFVNASTEDFLNPIRLLERNISFLNDHTLDYLNREAFTEQLSCFQNSFIGIRKSLQSIFMETPNRVDISFTKTINGRSVKYIFPSISYGIVMENGQNVCYIYTILHPKEKVENSIEQEIYYKKISKELYELNAGIATVESDEYKEYKEKESAYYPENISDVSPSSIVSMTVFLGLLAKENITCIKVIPYLPIRFLSRDLSDNIDNNNGIMQQRNIEIQKNVTDKFIRVFMRMSYHFPSLKINSFQYDTSEYMDISMVGFSNCLNNPIINEIFMSIENSLESIKTI